MNTTNIYDSWISYLQKLEYSKQEKLERHRILPQHAGGKYDKENILLCPFEFHKLSHYYRYLAYREPGDLIAWQLMSGMTEEGRRNMASYAGTLGGKAANRKNKEKGSLFFSSEWQGLHGFKGGGKRNLDSGSLARLNAEITANRPELRRDAGRKGAQKRIANQRKQEIGFFNPKHTAQKKGNLVRWGVVIDGVRVPFKKLSSDFVDYFLLYAVP